MRKTYFITLLVIVVLLLGVNIVFLFNYNNHKHCSSNNVKENKDKNINCSCFVSNSLSLDDKQSKTYEEIKRKHQSIAFVAIDSLHIAQERLMDYLSSNENDSLRIQELEDKIIEYQKQLLTQHIEQYKDLKAILKPEQIEPMNKLFKGLFVCKPSCKHKHDGCASQP